MEEKREMFYRCIAVCEGDINPRVLTCGDPARAKKSLEKLEKVKCLAKTENTIRTAVPIKAFPATVTSRGVGEGGAVIGFEPLPCGSKGHNTRRYLMLMQ